MPIYQYKVRDKQGQVHTGSLEAADDKTFRKRIDDEGYFLVEYLEKKESSSVLQKDLFAFTKKVKPTDLSVFCWQLYTMLNAGLTLYDSLLIIYKQISNEQLRAAIKKCGESVKEGMSFSEALKEHGHVFPTIFVKMVYAGEVGGVLDGMLKRLAVFFEKEADVKSRIKSALAYPSVLFVVSMGVIIFMITFILPKFSAVFEDLGTEIPVTTKFLLDLNVFLRSYWYMFVAGFIGGFILLKIYIKGKTGRLKFDHMKLTMPGFGDLNQKMIAARFTQTFSTMIGAGIPMLTALDVVNDTIGNTAVNDALRDIQTKVSEGKSIAQPMAESKVFPEMVVNMVKVGEETGSLDEVLTKVSEFYDREVDEAIKGFTKFIEPAMIVFMTVVIGFITISIFLPLTDIIQGVHG